MVLRFCGFPHTALALLSELTAMLSGLMIAVFLSSFVAYFFLTTDCNCVIAPCGLIALSVSVC